MEVLTGKSTILDFLKRNINCEMLTYSFKKPISWGICEDIMGYVISNLQHDMDTANQS